MVTAFGVLLVLQLILFSCTLNNCKYLEKKCEAHLIQENPSGIIMNPHQQSWQMYWVDTRPGDPIVLHCTNASSQYPIYWTYWNKNYQHPVDVCSHIPTINRQRQYVGFNGTRLIMCYRKSAYNGFFICSGRDQSNKPVRNEFRVQILSHDFFWKSSSRMTPQSYWNGASIPFLIENSNGVYVTCSSSVFLNDVISVKIVQIQSEQNITWFQSDSFKVQNWPNEKTCKNKSFILETQFTIDTDKFLNSNFYFSVRLTIPKTPTTQKFAFIFQVSTPNDETQLTLPAQLFHIPAYISTNKFIVIFEISVVLSFAIFVILAFLKRNNYIQFSRKRKELDLFLVFPNVDDWDGENVCSLIRSRFTDRGRSVCYLQENISIGEDFLDFVDEKADISVWNVLIFTEKSLTSGVSEWPQLLKHYFTSNRKWKVLMAFVGENAAKLFDEMFLSTTTTTSHETNPKSMKRILLKYRKQFSCRERVFDSNYSHADIDCLMWIEKFLREDNTQKKCHSFITFRK